LKVNYTKDILYLSPFITTQHIIYSKYAHVLLLVKTALSVFRLIKEC